MRQNFAKAVVMMGSASESKISFDDASNEARIQELNQTMLGKSSTFCSIHHLTSSNFISPSMLKSFIHFYCLFRNGQLFGAIF